MSNENLLIYPTVDLFVYDLAEGIGQNENKISENREEFWKKIYGDKILASQLEQLKQAEAETGDYIELLGDKQVVNFESPLEGYAYPVKIGDTYAAQFDLSGKIEPEDKKSVPEEIDRLGWQKEKIISRVNPPATIGQSWLVWGQLTANDQDALETAKNCYTKLNLFSNAKWDRDLKADGEFLGADFYELWRPPGDRGNIGDNHHVIICLFPYTSSQSIGDINKTVAKLYAPLMRLFAYRNKVIWAYTQSRPLKASLKHSYGEIQLFVNQLIARVNAPKADLKELQKDLVEFLKISSAYASAIIALEQQENIIKTNLENYDRRLETIGEKMGNDAEAFKFMAKFSDFVKEKYVWQVESDNRSLSAGLRLLENAIQTIEGIIEIERAKSDRTLNVTIGTVGAGIGISGVYASTYASQIQSPASPQKSMDVNAVFLWSIGLGILPVIIVSALRKIRKNWR